MTQGVCIRVTSVTSAAETLGTVPGTWGPGGALVSDPCRHAGPCSGGPRSWRDVQRARAGLSSVPVSWELCNKSPQPGGLKPTGVCGLTVREAWKSRCGWSWSLLDALRASMPLSWLPGVVSNPWCSLDVNHTLQVSTVRSCSSWRQIYTEPTMWVDLLTSIYDVHYDVMS